MNLTVAIQKGGVGKTITTTNLAALMGKEGKRVLVVDMDPQANTTYMLTGAVVGSGAFARKGVCNMMKTHGFVPTQSFVEQTNVPGVELIPSNNSTKESTAIMNVWSNESGERSTRLLAYCLDEIKDNYDCILFDTPPALDNLTVSCLVASDAVLIPCKPEDASLQGLNNTWHIVQMVNKEENKNIQLLGIVMTIVERTTLYTVIRDELLASDFAEDLCETAIRKGQDVNNSYRFAQPVVFCAPKSNPSLDYIALYEELKDRMARMQGMSQEEAND